jgi:hypothetical protein
MHHWPVFRLFRSSMAEEISALAGQKRDVRTDQEVGLTCVL